MLAKKTQIETSVLREVSNGDEEAFRVLFDHYKMRFYRTVFKMTNKEDVAEEIVQEVFIIIWQQHRSLGTVTNPDPYFFTILYRHVFRYYKALAMERNFIEMFAEASEKQVSDDAVLEKESSALIAAAIAKLPAQQKQVFELSRLKDLSREEVAKVMNISPNTVRNHLVEATKSVRKYLQKHLTILLLF